MNLEESYGRLAGRIRSAKRITVLTGAGVSAGSGVPTFRGAEGLWKNYAPEKLATPEAFQRDPVLVWEWYNWRRERISKCLPNPAHNVIAAWSRRCPGFVLITQNVDGLHEKAGTANVLRYHGSIWEVMCWQNCATSPDRWWNVDVPLSPLPPPCPYCGGWLRPGVVWFGEGIDPDIAQQAYKATECDLFLTVGTSSFVNPAASLVFKARRQGVFTVEINPEETPSSGAVDLAIQGPSELVLPDVERLLQS